MSVKSLIYDSRDKIDIDFMPTLAFLFFDSTNQELIFKCINHLKSINPNIEIVGVHGTKGNIISQIPFVINSSQISVMLFSVKNFFVETFDIVDFQKLKENFIKSYNKFNSSSVIAFFPVEFDTNYFLDRIQERQNITNVFGGVYSNNACGCFGKENFYNDKLLAVFFDNSEIEFCSKAIHGWKPIGNKLRVTKSYKNIVYKIDDEDALKVVEEYIGEIKQENIEKFLHPFCVNHDNNKSLASIKSINREDNSIQFFKYIYEGEDVRIAIPTNQHNMMKLIEDELKHIKCDGAFMFSCVGRYAYYGDLIEFEIAKLSKYIQFAGFFTFGEVGSSSTTHRPILQNQTMNLVFFKEKN